ncbi:DUF2332 domain-containing protein [Shimia sp. R10_1]|uniref:DUF2332 domain-containing protein n=1 Tax=Shimia sp. R10_1 TaxID=2821095 RepID=UPI001ADC3029|nr:DUF2332 domain-containing protein [Shimia sp. R10_1]
MSALGAALLEQAGHCEALDSPFMGRLLRLLSTHWPADTELASRCAAYTGDIGPKGHSLPLRIASGLHALVLKQVDQALTAVYPPNVATDAELGHEVLAALQRHDAFLCDWITNAPQTNEVRRSAVLIAAAQLLNERFGLPMKLSELGASAGLNLMFDHFHLAVGDGYGPKSDVVLTPGWQGALPPLGALTVVDRRGVDLHPLDSHDPEHALRLQAYLWADQAERITRTRAAIALQDAEVDAGDAIDWLEARVTAPQDGALHLIYSTVAWQYFPVEGQARGTKIMEAAGAQATEAEPLAWLSYEADSETRGAALTLRLWPGDVTIDLGRADFHGRWVDWRAPERLT